MRILIISGGTKPDYQCDMLFHGLRTMFGSDVVDYSRIWFMYEDEFRDRPGRQAKLYGRGFTIYGLLGSDADVDRTDIESKIRHRYYDMVIYGSVHRNRDFLEAVRASYEPNRILFVDGEDRNTNLCQAVMGQGLYFKREHDGVHDGLIPIQFAIPDVKIATSRLPKERVIAHIDPRNRATYIYQTESDYYRGYGVSRFGITMKKSGWDCLRHYEIMANDCVPLLFDLENCPSLTMTRLPRSPIMRLNRLLSERGEEYFDTSEGSELWEEEMAAIDRLLRGYLTTTALARYVVECQMRAMTDQAVLPAIPAPSLNSVGR